MAKFKLGDRVRLKDLYGSYNAGAEGVVQDDHHIPDVLFSGEPWARAVGEDRLELVLATREIRVGDRVRVARGMYGENGPDPVRGVAEVVSIEDNGRYGEIERHDGKGWHNGCVGSGFYWTVEMADLDLVEPAAEQSDRALEVIKAKLLSSYNLGDGDDGIYQDGYRDALREILGEVYRLQIVTHEPTFEPLPETSR